MNYDDDDDGELAALIEEDSMVIPDDDGRANPVFRPLQPLILAPLRRRDIDMPSNGGQKRNRTSKNSKKYKKYKNRKRQRKTRRVVMKKCK